MLRALLKGGRPRGLPGRRTELEAFPEILPPVGDVGLAVYFWYITWLQLRGVSWLLKSMSCIGGRVPSTFAQS
jgi:hypothetical protein